jgi:hypothetical protein
MYKKLADIQPDRRISYQITGFLKTVHEKGAFLHEIAGRGCP